MEDSGLFNNGWALPTILSDKEEMKNWADEEKR